MCARPGKRAPQERKRRGVGKGKKEIRGGGGGERRRKVYWFQHDWNMLTLSNLVTMSGFFILHNVQISICPFITLAGSLSVNSLVHHESNMKPLNTIGTRQMAHR